MALHWCAIESALHIVDRPHTIAVFLSHSSAQEIDRRQRCRRHEPVRPANYLAKGHQSGLPMDIIAPIDTEIDGRECRSHLNQPMSHSDRSVAATKTQATGPAHRAA